MKILLAAPAIPRFQWELDVCITNIRQFTDAEIVILFAENQWTVPVHFQDRPGVSVFTFTDNRDNTDYIPSIRPYLWWQYLKENPEAEKETYIFIDSDIIFREWIDMKLLQATPEYWYSSDCSSYIGYEYIMSRQNGPEIALELARICGISLDQLKNTPGAGAQWVIKNPTAAFWERAYHDNNEIHAYFQTVDSDIQKWTAGMWAELFGMTREGITVDISPELDFCLPTDDIKKWDEVKILHNAGVTADLSHELFFKGKYVHLLPWKEDFSFVRTDRASIKYVQALQCVVL